MTVEDDTKPGAAADGTEPVADTDTAGTAGATDTVDATDTAESTAEAPDAQRSPGLRARVVNFVRIHVIAVLLTVAIVAAAGLAAWTYFVVYLPDRQTDAAAAESVVLAATEGTEALLSYSPDTLDGDFANAKSHLTGDFLSYYSDFTQTIVTPAAQQKAVQTEARVVQSAVSDLEPDSAVVLVFVNQMTTSNENPDGAFAVSSVKVGLKKVDGNWLIEAFDPV